MYTLIEKVLKAEQVIFECQYGIRNRNVMY